MTAAFARPAIACSHTVSGTATLRFYNGTTEYYVTIPEGVYWTDPLIYGGFLDSVTDSPDLVGRLCKAMTDRVSSASYVYTSGTNNSPDALGNPAYYSIFNDGATGTLAFRMGSVVTPNPITDAGRLIARRIGINQLATDPTSSPAVDYTASAYMHGYLNMLRGECVDLDGTWLGWGVANQALSNKTYGGSRGEPSGRKVLCFDALPRVQSRKRIATAPTASTNPDVSFESAIWYWLSLGESIHYYSDIGKDTGFLKVAMAKNDVTLTIDQFSLSVFGAVATGDMLCVDGENMRVQSAAAPSGGNIVVTVYRREPVAHAKYAPIAKNAICGTFRLDRSGGNVSLEKFMPKRRAAWEDFWDYEIPLMQGAHA